MLGMTAERAGVRRRGTPRVVIADADACVRRSVDPGGEVCVEPTFIPAGRFAVVEDPSGAVFSILKLAAE
jgi:predicted enzyme related to lactoylglutathione lyase